MELEVADADVTHISVEQGSDSVVNAGVRRASMEVEVVDASVIPLLDEQGHDSVVNAACIPDVNKIDFDISGSLLGVSRKTVDEIHELYLEHSRALGFGVRKSTQRLVTGTKDIISEKYFVCSCEGFSNADKRDKNANLPSKVADTELSSKKKRKQGHVTRTGCNAGIRVKLNKVGEYEVINHVREHNHALMNTEWQRPHRFQGGISEEQSAAILAITESGIGPVNIFTHNALDNDVGNHVGGMMKMTAIEGWDAQNVVDMLYQNATKEPDLFFRFQLDSEGKLCNIFWRDSMMKEDYQIYGDVTVFDTTYRTNRYNLICAPFFGINNHCKNVMFGCAFLADENVESFEWLFETFKKSMDGKPPLSLYTDQDLAMSNAIAKVFPDIRHRLCLWHLQQNAVSRVGELKVDDSFKDAFDKCLKGCKTVEEFETHWSKMVRDYELEGDVWFSQLYSLKEKWFTALSNDFFSAGILSSQRCERIYNAIGFRANKSTSLTEFFGIFKATVKRWRSIEESDELQCSRSFPTSDLLVCGLLKHAAEVYTLTLFKDFEEEFRKAMGTTTRIAFQTGTNTMYEVCLEDDSASAEHVSYSCLNDTVDVSCTCKNFEEVGWLCYHCLRIMHMHSISRIPEHYIVRRWTKYAKTEVWDRLKCQQRTPNTRQDSVAWRHDMARKFYNLLLKSEGNQQARRIIEDGYNRDLITVDGLLGSQGSYVNESVTNTEPSAAGSAASGAIVVMDSVQERTKSESRRNKDCEGYSRCNSVSRK